MYIEVTKLQEVRSVQLGASGSSGAHRLWRVAGAEAVSEVALQHKTARVATLARLRPRAELAHRSKRLGSLGPSRRVPTLGPASAKKAQVLGRRRSKVDHFLFSCEQGAGLFSSRRSRPCFAAHSSRPARAGPAHWRPSGGARVLGRRRGGRGGGGGGD